MARSTIKRITSLTAFMFFSLAILAIAFFTIASIISKIDINIIKETLNDPYFKYVIKLNLVQAFLSTIICIPFSIFIAKALHRQYKFWGRKFIIHFINISFSFPGIILVLGLITIHGINGWINIFLDYLLKTSLRNYINGTIGVILAHLALFLPLATRGFLNYLNSTSPKHYMLSNQLGFSSWKIFRYIEWPAIKSSIIQISVFIFILCFTSFIIILILGGGPIITNIEISIYETIRLDLNLVQASVLSMIQIIICIFLLLLARNFNSKIFIYSFKNDDHFLRYNKNSFLIKLVDIFFISALFTISILPFISIFKDGINSSLIHLFHSIKFMYILKQSILTSLISAILTLIISFSLISGAFYFYYNLNKKIFATAIIFLGNIRMIISTYIFITCIFLIANNFQLVMIYAGYLIIITNSLTALPFVINILWNQSINFTKYEINLCRQLNINYWNFIKIIYYPRIKNSLGYAFSFAMVTAFGNFGLIALFNNEKLNTMPHLIYKMLGNYKMEEAISTSFIIILISIFLFWITNEIWSTNRNVRN